MKDSINEMKGLIKELNKYSMEYYVMDSPTVSDAIYDSKYDKLIALEKETGTILPGSPSQRIGDGILPGFKKINHINKLWSLDKAQTNEELKSYLTSVAKAWESYKKINPNSPQPKFIVMKKFDGLSLATTYNEEGNLELSATRGTGEIGEDVTEQSKTINNLPHTIDYSNRIVVHGEAIMTKKAFDEYNKTAIIPLKNLRNGASGTIRNLNLAECRKRKLSIVYYNITDTVENFDSLSSKIDFIKNLGLPTVEYKICNDYEEILNEIEQIKSERSSLQYDIDGVVIKVDDIALSEFMGYTVKYPKYAIAFKFEADETTTTLLDVEWNVGRTGRVNPKAIVEAVDLGGATVKRATLNNMDDIIKKNVKIGSEVIIRRSNDVIPEILGVINEEFNHNKLIEISAPTNCPSCGGVLTKTGAFFFCENTLGCKPQIVKSIVHFCQREAMNIDGFSIKTAEQFVDNGIISSIPDLYNLHDKRELILSLDKFGEKKYNNLITNIDKSKKCNLHQLVFGLGISNVGLKTAKDLSKHFKSMENIKNATVEKLLEVSDVGDTIADSIVKWFNNNKNIYLLNLLLSYLELEEVVEAVAVDNPFVDKTIVVTGTLKGYGRKEIKDKLEALGAKVSGSVSKKTDYLLYGEEAGSKLDKAISLNVKIITEEEFENMIK